jgi:Glucose-6-phosphate dehydrogenase, NAD binding domain
MATRTVEPATTPSAEPGAPERDRQEGSDRAPRAAIAPPAQPNPLREGLRHERMAEPCTMVICGATGDLTERKLAPALYNTLLGGFLPPEFTVVGFARRELSDEAFRDHLLTGINKYSRNRPVKDAIWESMASSPGGLTGSTVIAARPATASSTWRSRPASTRRS